MAPESFPLRLGSAQDYERILGVLRAAHFTEENIIRVLSLEDMSDLGLPRVQNADVSDLSPRLAMLIRLFLFFEPVPHADLERMLGVSTLGALLALGIVRPAEGEGRRCRAAVFFYPVAGYYMTSDSMVGPDYQPVAPFQDWLLPAVFEETLRFVSLLPKGHFSEVLDLGTGTGIAALALARNCVRAVAVDITQRAVEYARFNGEFNGCDNLEVLLGDLYAPVEGRTFECIVAHPPYVPVAGEALTYRDAGETGEEIGRRIIEGLPMYLRAGGVSLVLMRGFDTEGASFEVRASRWLGPAEAEFEVAYARLRENEPLERTLQEFIERKSLDATAAARMRQLFERLGATNFTYGALTLRRS